MFNGYLLIRKVPAGSLSQSMPWLIIDHDKAVKGQETPQGVDPGPMDGQGIPRPTQAVGKDPLPKKCPVNTGWHPRVPNPMTSCGEMTMTPLRWMSE